MVIKGDAGMQVMGDWAKGEFAAAKQEAGQGLLCAPLPGHRRRCIYNIDMFAMFQLKVPDRHAGARLALAKAMMSPEFQEPFNVIKGSVPARMDVPDATSSTPAARRASPT